MNTALFLDRDGVVIENCDTYVRSWEDVEIFPQALEALALLKNSPFKIVLVTNQSAVGRGIITLAQAESINARLVQVIEKNGGRVDGLFMCPHAPDVGCDCRKPLPGLFHQAARVLNLNLVDSIMVGDALSDLQAGQAAGISRNVLVRTGRGQSQLQLPLAQHLKPFQIYNSLLDLVKDLSPFR